MTTIGIARPTHSALASAYAPSSKSSFVRQVVVETRKLFDTRSGRWLVASGLILTITFAIISVVATAEAARQGHEVVMSWAMAATSVGVPLGIFLALLAILTITSEWSQRTALTTFALEPRRGRVLLAKVVMLAVITLALVALSVGAGAILVVAAHAAGAPTSWVFTAAQLGGYAGNMLLATAMGIAFGLVFLSSPMSIVLYFVLPMVGQIVQGLGALWEPLTKVSPWLFPSESLAALQDGVIAGDQWWHLLTSCLLWIGLPAAIGTWRWLNRQVV